MRRGILIKDGSALERLVEADTALFDKTGTLTLGRPVPAAPFNLTANEASAALALARASRHPLSKALAAALEAQGSEPADVEELEEQPGNGVSARYDGELARLGRPEWLGLEFPVISGLLTAFALGDGPVHALKFDDALRPDAADAFVRMRELGLKPMIVSGDRGPAVRAAAEPLGIECRAGMTPHSKFAFINALQAEGRRVLMVGDGLNDGPALKAAHVSIAPSSASDVGQTAADLLFLGESLSPVPVAIIAARRTMRVIHQNFALAVTYNLIAVPLAMSGLVTPLIAALAMSGSSLLVVANALRLTRCTR
jgi:Cu2+-exporting ATPase